MRSLLLASTKVIPRLNNNRLTANASSDPIPNTIDHMIPNTIDHMIPNMGGALLGPGDWKSKISGTLKWSYSQNSIFVYLNEGLSS